MNGFFKYGKLQIITPFLDRLNLPRKVNNLIESFNIHALYLSSLLSSDLTQTFFFSFQPSPVLIVSPGLTSLGLLESCSFSCL